MPSIAQIVIEKYTDPKDPIRVSSVKKPEVQKEPIVLTEEQKESKANIIHLLRHGRVRVSFTKVDGTPAIMECTLDPMLLPTETRDPSKPAAVKRVYPQHTIRAYALDRQGWRSFLVPNVISATLISTC